MARAAVGLGGRSASAALLLLLLVVPSASAHAWLLSSDPLPNGHVEAAPPSVVLRFTENVEREYSGATVSDLDGNRVDDGRTIFYPGGHRNEFIVTLDDVSDGVYAVRWQTLSVDTHTASGSFLFAVGNATLSGAQAPAGGHEHNEDEPEFWLEASSRSVFYLGVAAAFGIPLFLLAVWPVAAPAHVDLRPRRAATTGAALAAAGALAGIGVLAFFADRIQTGPFAAGTSTRTGWYLTGRIAALAVGSIALAVAARVARHGLHRARPLLGTSLVFGLAAAVLTGLSSHAAAVRDDGALPFLADFVHVLAGATWIGGLVAFAIVLPGQRAAEAGRLVRRFSPFGMTTVFVLGSTGVYSALLHVRSFGELFGTLYGQAILVKVGLLGVLVLFGAWNQFILGPRLKGRRARSDDLRWSVIAEAGILLLVVMAAGVLSTSAPPAGEAPGDDDAFTIERATSKSHLILAIQPSPPTVGFQNITITVHTVDDRPLPPGTEVYFTFQAPNTTKPDEITTPNRSGTNSWSLSGGYFTQRGTWTVHVTLQRPDEYAVVPFPVNVR